MVPLSEVEDKVSYYGHIIIRTGFLLADLLHKGGAHIACLHN